MNSSHFTHIHLYPFDNRRLATLCGQQDENLRQIEHDLGVAIHNRGNHFQISGRKTDVEAAEAILNRIYRDTETEDDITPAKIHLYLQDSIINDNKQPLQPQQRCLQLYGKPANRTRKQAKTKSRSEGSQTTLSTQTDFTELDESRGVAIRTKAGIIRGHTPHQRQYLENVQKYDINFSIGPAGTGKTYLAVASAVDALNKGSVRRLFLVRPAVEAGEKLGFLPGGLEQKVEPYLRPLYDALFEMLGFERVGKLIEQNIIEVAPLAYMRGRTLNDAFIILDESQNTTTEQMKMFLTRMGFNSKVIITGDLTQTDLPKEKKSGLVEATEVLKGIKGIYFSYFDSNDVVRHHLVQQIVEAYAEHEAIKTAKKK